MTTLTTTESSTAICGSGSELYGEQKRGQLPFEGCILLSNAGRRGNRE